MRLRHLLKEAETIQGRHPVRRPLFGRGNRPHVGRRRHLGKLPRRIQRRHPVCSPFFAGRDGAALRRRGVGQGEIEHRVLRRARVAHRRRRPRRGHRHRPRRHRRPWSRRPRRTRWTGWALEALRNLKVEYGGVGCAGIGDFHIGPRFAGRHRPHGNGGRSSRRTGRPRIAFRPLRALQFSNIHPSPGVHRPEIDGVVRFGPHRVGGSRLADRVRLLQRFQAGIKPLHREGGTVLSVGPRIPFGPLRAGRPRRSRDALHALYPLFPAGDGKIEHRVLPGAGIGHLRAASRLSGSHVPHRDLDIDGFYRSLRGGGCGRCCLCRLVGGPGRRIGSGRRILCRLRRQTRICRGRIGGVRRFPRRLCLFVRFPRRLSRIRRLLLDVLNQLRQSPGDALLFPGRLLPARRKAQPSGLGVFGHLLGAGFVQLGNHQPDFGIAARRGPFPGQGNGGVGFGVLHRDLEGIGGVQEAVAVHKFPAVIIRFVRQPPVQPEPDGGRVVVPLHPGLLRGGGGDAFGGEDKINGCHDSAPFRISSTVSSWLR